MSINDDTALNITIGGFVSPFNPSLLATYGWLQFELMDSILITNYCERASDRLIEQFETKQNINKYLCALIEPFQELEYVFGDLLQLRTLSLASDAQLDGLGDIVGIARKGLADDAYRNAIRFQIGLNFSNGEPETIIALAKNLTEATQVNLKEIYPATMQILTNGTNVDGQTRKLLEQSALAGVAIELIVNYSSIPFAFEPDPGDIDPIPQGFSEPNYAPDAGKGGNLTERFL
jgi:hypothetical protein